MAAKLDMYEVQVVDMKHHFMIHIDNLSSLGTVDITSEFVKEDYRIYYDGSTYTVINFYVQESDAYPGRDRIDVACYKEK